MSHSVSDHLVKKKKDKAQAYLRAGRFSDAKAAYTRLCAKYPRDLDAWRTLGQINERLGALSDAEACYRKAIELRPKDTEAHVRLSVLAQSSGRNQLAIEHYRQALEAEPDRGDLHYSLGAVCQAIGDLNQAETAYRRAVALDPRLAGAYNNLGTVLSSKGSFDDAIACFQEALKWHSGAAGAPSSPPARQPATAAGAAPQPLEISIYCNLGLALSGAGRLVEARDAYRSARRVDPANAAAVAGEAHVLERSGEVTAAYDLLAPLVDSGVVERSMALVFARLCRKFGRCEDAVALLKKILADRSLDNGQRYDLHLWAGKLLEGLERFDEAFGHYRSANELMRRPYDPDAQDVAVDALVAAFSPEFFARAPTPGFRSDLPVFIVGMPRSGTSLVEQILASHPAVYGAGEQGHIHQMTAALPKSVGSELGYPECISLLTGETLDALAESYASKMQALAPAALRVTDKLPHNFLHLGLIALLFPEARVIHCVRDPLDTCLSCYTSNFAGHHPYAHDLFHLGRYYASYTRLMAHWRRTLSIRWMDVRYEELVRNQETISRELVDFCGLEWDDRCLRFNEAERFVATASYDQVRRPMYDSSIGRWKKFDKQLAALRSGLGLARPEGVDL